MKRVRIQVSNSFHGTSTTLMVPDRPDWRWTDLSERQTRRLWRVLCGSKECTCGVIR